MSNGWEIYKGQTDQDTPSPTQIDSEEYVNSSSISQEQNKGSGWGIYKATATGDISKAETPEQEESIVKNFALGVAETLGLATDATLRGVVAASPFGLAASWLEDNTDIDLMRDLDSTTKEMQEIGSEYNVLPAPGREGTSFGARAARFGGGAILPHLSLLKRGQTVVQGGKVAKGFLDKAALNMAKRPIAATGLEATSAVSAAGAGHIAREDFNVESPWALAAIEMTGGILPSTAMSFSPARAVWRKTADAIGLDQKGGNFKATKRITGAVDNADDALSRLDRVGKIDGRDVTLTPAGKIGDPDLLAIEKAVFATDHTQRGKWMSTLKQSVKSLKKMTTHVGSLDDLDNLKTPENIKDTRKFFEAKRQHLKDVTDLRFEQANQQINDLMDSISNRFGEVPESAKVSASKRTKQIVIDAMEDARTQESQLWNSVDSSITGNANGGKSAYKSILDGWDVKSQGDMREVLPKRVLDVFGYKTKKGKIKWGSLFSNKKQPLTAKQIHNARRVIQNAWKNEVKATAPDQDKLRMLNEVSDALYSDLEKVHGGIDSPFNQAMEYSRELNKKFRTGTMGRLHGIDATSAERIAGEDTLSVIMGGRGVEADLDRLLAATPQARPEIENYIYASFLQQVPDGKKLNPQAYTAFMNKNAGILARFPEVKDQIASIKDATKFVAKYQRTQNLVHDKYFTNKGRLGAFLDAGVDNEVGSIFSSKNPKAYARSIVGSAKMDKTGKALKGLKYATGEHILKKVSGSSPKRLPDGSTMLVPDGFKMKGFLNDRRNREALKTIYSAQEMQNLHKIADSFSAASASLLNTAEKVGISTDKPSMILDWLARHVALKSMAGTTKDMGAGGIAMSQRTSSAMGKLVAKFGGRHIKYISQAITEESVMKKFLTPIDDPKAPLAMRGLLKWMEASSTGVPIANEAIRNNEQP